VKVSGISSPFGGLSRSSGQVSHVLLTRSPLGLQEQAPWTSFDLHVLSVPPAFVLSQDQTLRRDLASPSSIAVRQRRLDLLVERHRPD
jgi:hypothetical protein